MSKTRLIVILLAVGFLVSPMLLWMLVSSPAAVSAQSGAPCNNCIWLPLIGQGKANVPLIVPTPTATPLIVPTPPPGTPAVKPLPTVENPNIEQHSIVWTLDGATISSPGSTGVMNASEDFPGGYMTSGYTLRAKALSNQPDIAFSGDLKIVLTVFSPAVDYKTQKAGTWYVQGNWTITREGVSAAALKTRHNPNVLSGQFSAELPFNPANGQGNWTGTVKLPMSQSAGRWARGTGTLSFDANLNGYLALDANVWPEMK